MTAADDAAPPGHEPGHEPGQEPGYEPGALSGAATMLPTAPPPVRGRPRRFRLALTAIAAVVVVLVVVVVVALAGGSSGKKAPEAAARRAGRVPKAAIFAMSDTAITDTAGVNRDTLALLAGRLPAATLSAAARDALTHPPVAGTAAVTLGPALSLEDPQLPSCLAAVTDGDTLFGIDRVSYNGTPSLLVVTADSGSATDAFAYVLGSGCALPGTGIRTFATVPLGG